MGKLFFSDISFDKQRYIIIQSFFLCLLIISTQGSMGNVLIPTERKTHRYFHNTKK